MTTASLELCKQLFAISSWEGPEVGYYHDANKDETLPRHWSELNSNANFLRKWSFICPAYDLGFLREQTIEAIERLDVSDRRKMELHDRLKNALLRGEGTTCELASELFKQGILIKEAK